MKAYLDQFLLLSVAVLVKAFFLIYRSLAWLLLPLSLIMLFALIYSATSHFFGLVVIFGLFAASVVTLYRYTRESPPEDGRAVSSSKKIIEHFIAWIGTLKYFSSPLCVVEDPGSYRIRGADIRALLDDDILQPGDILLRGYRGYVDGELIRRTGGAQGAGSYFSHAALYLGPVDAERDRDLVADRLQIRQNGGWRMASIEEKEKVRNSPEYFLAGKEMVAHSMARGVHLEDILTFLRCDYLVVLRLPETIRIGDDGGRLHPVFRPGDDDSPTAVEIDVRLQEGQTVSRDEIIASARRAALRCVGVGYDFLFEECRSFHRFSCSEFVYFCFKGIHRYIGLKASKHGFAGLFARNTISPPDIYNAAEKAGKLQVVWSNVR